MPRASTIASPKLLLPLAALLTTLPLMLHGNSCGQDLTFHLQSWIDAARQLRHFHYPRWDATAAWNAGEPRFLFYPPLSWLLGALLTLILPARLIDAAPIAFIFIALLASGLAFHHLARRFVSPNAALIASALYLANPYMLFNAFERSALAELLAAAWIPLLLLALLRSRPTVRGIAIPLALLWLTNVPAAIMGSYLVALLAVLRLLQAFNARRPRRALTITFVAGTLLGLALPAFYLIPAVSERRLIQASMALIPPLRYQDNFLFTHTSDAAHNAVNHTASLLALTLLLLTAATVAVLLLEAHPALEASIPTVATPASLVVIPEAGAPSDRICSLGREGNPRLDHPPLPLDPTLTLLTLLIAFLLTPLSTPIWRHLPELAFLQFPWRLLTLLTPILALTIGLLLDRTFFSPSKASSSRPLRTSFHPTKIPSSRPKHDGLSSCEAERPLYSAGARFPKEPHRGMSPAIILTLALPLILSLALHHLYAQPCDPADTPSTLAHNLATHHGTLPTDEYTPATADNDLLRSDNPGFWLAPLTDPNLPAPNTHPTATELDPSIDTDDTPIPLSQTLSTPAPHHLSLNLPHPAVLVLNLRSYPNWRITLTHPSRQPSPSAQDAAQDRNDGLIVLTVPSGDYTIDVAWRRTPDQTLGLALSAVALLLLASTFLRGRRPHPNP